MDKENLNLDDLEKVTGGVNGGTDESRIPIVMCPKCGHEFCPDNSLSGGRIRCELCGYHWI